MTPSSRKELGIALVSISFAAAVLIQSTTGKLVHVTSDEEPPVSGPLFSTQTTFLTLTFGWRYAVPIAACATFGLYCLIVSQRATKRRS